jgi:FSR family fosmidomycin resistance protein-like MFS transporter
MGGIGAAVLGVIADRKSIGFVYHLCSFLPMFGLLTVFLPAEKTLLRRASPAGQPSRRG